MGRILKAIGFWMLAIVVTIGTVLAGIFFTAVATVVSVASLGLALLGVVAYTLKDYAAHRRKQKGPP